MVVVTTRTSTTLPSEFVHVKCLRVAQLRKPTQTRQNKKRHAKDFSPLTLIPVFSAELYELLSECSVEFGIEQQVFLLDALKHERKRLRQSGFWKNLPEHIRHERAAHARKSRWQPKP